MKWKNLFIPIVGILLIIGAYQAGTNAGGRYEQIAITDTVYVEKLTTKYVPSPPETVIISETIEVERTRVDTVRIPIDMPVHGVVSENPISIKGSKVRYRYFDLERQAYVQNTYSVPRRRFQGAVIPSFSDKSAAITANISFKNITVSAATIQTFDGRGWLWHAGIGYSFRF